jgi:hypothetical protein
MESDADAQGYDRSVPFSALCELFERCSRSSKVEKRKKLLNIFFSNYKSEDYFQVMRLLLPQVNINFHTYRFLSLFEGHHHFSRRILVFF